MARESSLLQSTTPTAIAPAQVLIGHVQLRDLIICPQERGIVNYIQRNAIVEQNINVPNAPPRTIAELDFTPNSLTSLTVGANDVLLAAGGQDADIYISYHTPASSASSSGRRLLKNIWSINGKLAGSINNSVLLTSLSLSNSNESSVEPRVGISNNDCTVRLYDVPIRGQQSKRVRRNEQALREAGALKLDVPINHSSISPDGRTLLSVGDSNKVYFHHISGGARVTFSQITALTLPPPDYSPLAYPSSSLAASFSTAFSSDGIKFAVASQEGIVAVWDVRSSKAVKVFQTDKGRGTCGTGGNGSATGWLSDDPWDWTRGSSRAPGWSVRNVKFGGGSGGREVMTFTEHTSLLHIVDARTFETDEIIHVPSATKCPSMVSSSQHPSTQSLQESQQSPPSASHVTPRYMRASSQHSYLPLPRISYSPMPPASSRSFSPASPRSPAFPPTSPGSAPRFIISASSNVRNQPRTPPSPTVSQSGRTPAIVQALGDAFRIPPLAYSPPESIGDSTWRTLSGLGTRVSTSRSTAGAAISDRAREAERERERARERTRERDRVAEDDYDDIVVIPPLGDRDVESEVHALLQIHGIAARQASTSPVHGVDDRNEGEHDHDFEEDEEDANTGSNHADYEYTMRGGTRGRRRGGYVGQTEEVTPMEVDELESDCLSSHTPSRSSSPSPSTIIGFAPARRSNHPMNGFGGGNTSSRHHSRSTVNDPGMDVDIDDEIPHEEDLDTGYRVDIKYENELDLAGVCFDPSGERMYVASTKSVVEWAIKGAEKRWYTGCQWR